MAASVGKLRVLGHYVSQPSRAVLWLLKIKKEPFELTTINPVTGEARTEEFRKINPAGTIPVLQDGDVTLFESPAIMGYLCDKNGWSDMYPTKLVPRARVNQYLHWHHGNMRHCTQQLFRPSMMEVMGVRKLDTERLERGRETVDQALRMLEDSLLCETGYVAGTPGPSIADISAYCEIDQLVICGLHDMQQYKRLSAWIKAMQALPEHDEVRRSLFKFGDMVQKHFKAKGKTASL